jgi:hypothetical protein
MPTPTHRAVKSPLTGQTMLLPTDEVAAYQTLLQSLIDQHCPGSYEEGIQVQLLVDTEWRLRRIPALETGIYGLGRRELAGLHAECEDPQKRAAMIEAETFLKYGRELAGLSLQETRLLRMRAKDLARLRELQAERKKHEQTAAWKPAVKPAAARSLKLVPPRAKNPA